MFVLMFVLEFVLGINASLAFNNRYESLLLTISWTDCKRDGGGWAGKGGGGLVGIDEAVLFLLLFCCGFSPDDKQPAHVNDLNKLDLVESSSYNNNKKK